MTGGRIGEAERGYTLLEIVAASVPAALIGLVLFSVFGFTAGFSQRGARQAETFGQARLALTVLAGELRESSAAPGAIMISSRDEGAVHDGIGFLIARAADPGRPFVTDSSGMPHWQEAVFYLLDHPSGELRRITGEATNLSAPPFRAKGRVMATQATRMRAEVREGLVTITLTAGRPPGEAILEIAVRPRN